MKIRLFATLRERVGQRELNISRDDANSIQDLLTLLVKRFPEAKELLFRNGELSSFYHILVNGKNVRQLDGKITILKDDDIIAILPPIGGG